MSNGFDRLPHDEQVDVMRQLAERAAPEFAFDAFHLRLLNYRENAVFAVEQEGSPKAVLRVHRHGYRTEAELRSELAWTAALTDAGIPTPAAISAANGAQIVHAHSADSLDQRMCTALAWVDGKAPTDNPVSTFETLGQISAKIHAQGSQWTKPAWFVRPVLDEITIFGPQGVWGNFADLDALTNDQRELLSRASAHIRGRLSGFEKIPATWGLVHGDLMPENILLASDGLRVIDFDDSGFSWFVNDLATAVTMHLGTEQFDELCSAWIKGYRSFRSMTDQELDFLPDLIMARLLQFLGWGHTRKYSETAIAMTSSVVEGACQFAEALLAEQPHS